MPTGGSRDRYRGAFCGKHGQSGNDPREERAADLPRKPPDDDESIERLCRGWSQTLLLRFLRVRLPGGACGLDEREDVTLRESDAYPPDPPGLYGAESNSSYR